MTFFLLPHGADDSVRDRFIRYAAAQHPFQVGLMQREKARTKFSVRGDANAVAVRTERSAHRTDRSEFGRVDGYVFDEPY